MPPEEVFRRAGLLPVALDDERYFQELKDWILRLSDDDRADVLAYAQFRYQRAQRKPQESS